MEFLGFTGGRLILDYAYRHVYELGMNVHGSIGTKDEPL